MEVIHSPFLQNVLGWLAGLSFITFVLSLLLIPYFVGLLAPDCFLKLSTAARIRPALTAGSLCFLIIRNVLGLFLLAAGISMLFLPGQGLLTILLGILLLSLPGKHRLVSRLLRSPGVRHSLDWLRKMRRKPPFIWPDSADVAPRN
ncbi:MAG: hypothetical protein ACD_75C00439G0012 [uncultured bacterium]|nr:MAG: hypothetical protein ACD_75C00439G0012 [uncultured bacterium]